MNVRRISGIVAAASAVGILVLAVVASVAGALGAPGAIVGGGPAGIGPGMMSGGYGMMGSGSGAGMMGGSGMMGGGYGMMGGYGTSQTSGAPITDAPTVTVTARDVSFSPNEIVLPKDKVNLTLVNEGGVLHDLTIPALGVRVVAAGGQTATVGLRDLRAGRYDGFCSVPGHAAAGMRIAVVVQ